MVVPVIAAGVVLPITGGLDRFNVPPNVKFPLVVTVPVRVRPFTVPVPPTLVTVPLVLDLLLKVVQSVLVKYPFTLLVAAGMDIAGVAPPDDTTGLVPVTLVTVPTLIEPPRLVLVPLIVIAEFVRLELPMLLKVLVEPEIDLFVRVSVVPLPTKVVVASGKVIT